MPRTKLQAPNFYLTKRTDGYYDIRYEENGNTRTKSTGTKNHNEAEAFRARFLADYKRPRLAALPTVAEICDAYIKYRTPLVASPQHLPYSFNPVKRHIGSLHASTITQTVVDDYIDTRENERPERKGGRFRDEPVGEATISKELRMLRAALNWAAAEQLIDNAPNYRIELSSGDTRLRWLTKPEANRLVAESAPHLALFILIALSTAKRREAVLSLTWDRVNLKLPGHETLDFGDDVGNKRRGLTPIGGNARLINALTEAKGTSTSEYVIAYKGERISDVKTALTAASRRAGIDPAVSAHVLKHTAITWMVQANVSYEKIAKFTNTSAQIIERVYGHHSPEFVAEAVSAVAF